MQWNLTLHFTRKKLCQNISKKCLTSAFQIAILTERSRERNKMNLENQRSINTQTLKIL
jgi:hypothetical protein